VINVSDEENQDGKKKIRIEVDRSPEVERLRKENEAIASELKEKRAILEAQAMEALEKDKKEIMDMARIGKLTDEQLADIEEKLQDPTQVKSIKMLVSMISNQIEKVKTDLKRKIPDGKAPIIPPHGEEFEDKKTVIAELYRTARDPKAGATAEQKRDAEEKITELWRSFMKNDKSRQLKSIVDMTICPDCSHSNTSPVGASVITCEKCGRQYR
jgi:ribosomal protein S13